MTISFVDVETNTVANGGNLTLTLSNLAGLQEDDFVLIAVSNAMLADRTMAASLNDKGWTPLADLYSDDTFDANLGVFAKFMGPTPDTSVTMVGNAGANDGNAGVAMAFRGVDKTRPFDVLPTTATGTNTGNADPPSITPSGASGVWTVIAGAVGNSTQSGSYTLPTGYTTNPGVAQGGDTNDSMAFLGYNSSPSNPENPGTLSFSGSDSTSWAWAACTIALRPAETLDLRLVGSGFGNSVAGADITLTLPTLLENDLVIVASMVPRNTDIDVQMTTSGYTEVADLHATDTNHTNLGVFYKKMGATPDTTAVTNGGGDASDGPSAVFLAFRGVDTATPMDVAATTASGSNNGQANPPSIDYSDPDTIVVVAGARGHAIGASTGTGLTLSKNYMGVTATGNGSRDSSVALGYAAAHMVSDPEDPNTMYEASSVVAGSTIPVSTAADSWCAVTMALRKAVAAAGGSQFISIIVGI